MKQDLSSMQIFNDFISKTILNDTEIDILKRYVKGDTIIKISSDIALSTSSVSRIIAELKQKYKKYKEYEIAKLILLRGNN